MTTDDYCPDCGGLRHLCACWTAMEENPKPQDDRDEPEDLEFVQGKEGE